jgi:hypothetical protein
MIDFKAKNCFAVLAMTSLIGLFQKQLVGVVIGFVPVTNIETFQKSVKFPGISLVNLEPHQDTTEIRAVVTIMEQADVPAVTYLHQKI